jgi:hypothetical protein
VVVDKRAGFERKDIWFKKGRLGVENRTTRACDVVRSPSKGIRRMMSLNSGRGTCAKVAAKKDV